MESRPNWNASRSVTRGQPHGVAAQLKSLTLRHPPPPPVMDDESAGRAEQGRYRANDHVMQLDHVRSPVIAAFPNARVGSLTLDIVCAKSYDPNGSYVVNVLQQRVENTQVGHPGQTCDCF